MDSIPISAVPMSAFIMFGVVVLATVFAMKVGFSQLTAFALALPMAGVLVPLVSQTVWISQFVEWITSTAYGTQALFAFLVVPSYVFMRLIVRDGYGTTGKPIQGFMSAMAALLMILVFKPFLPFVSSIELPALIAPFFGTGFVLWWFIASLGLLGFAWRTTDSL